MTATEYTQAYRPHSDRITAALLEARIAATNRTQAQGTYSEALQHAHHCGASYAQIAAAVGTTRQAVRQYLTTN